MKSLKKAKNLRQIQALQVASWGELAFLSATVLFLTMAVGCGLENRNDAKSPPPKVASEKAKSASATPTPTPSPSSVVQLVSISPSVVLSSSSRNAPPSQMRSSSPGLVIGSSAQQGALSKPETVTQPKKKKGSGEPMTDYDLVFSRDKVIHHAFLKKNVRFVGVGLYADHPADKVIGDQYLDFLKQHGLLVRELMADGFVYIDQDFEKMWMFLNPQAQNSPNPRPERVLRARFVLGILCELQKMKDGALVTATRDDLIALMNQRDPYQDYTDESHLCSESSKPGAPAAEPGSD